MHFGPHPHDPRVVFVGEPGKLVHPSDSWRVGRPSYELKKRGYDTALTATEHGLTMPLMNPDVCVLPRLTPEPEQFKEFVAAMHSIGCAVILDWDDTPNFHPVFHKGTVWVERAEKAWICVGIADAVTGTTPDLVAHLAPRAKRAYWTPNLIAPEQWHVPPAEGRPDALTIGVMGGDSHSADWQMVLPELWPRLARRYPHLRFVVCGYLPPWMTKLVARYKLYGQKWMGIFDYPRYVKCIDIGLAPLTDTEFNRMKSPIKWMEYTLAGAAVVASPLMYGTWIEHGRTGLLAQTADEWFAWCCYLIEDATERNRLVSQAREEVLAYHTFNDERLRAWMNIYGQVYREVFDGRLPDAAARSTTARVQRRTLDQYPVLVHPDGATGPGGTPGGRGDGDRRGTLRRWFEKGSGPEKGHTHGDSGQLTRLLDTWADEQGLDQAIARQLHRGGQ